MARIRVPGRFDPKPLPPNLGVLSEYGGTAENVKAVHVGAARADAKPQELEGLKPDSIVELTFDTGASFYQRYDQLVEDMPLSMTRGVEGEEDTINLSVGFPGLLTRGGREANMIEAVRTFDINLPAALGDAAGTLAGKPLAEQFDQWIMKTAGLRHWSPETGIDVSGAPVTPQDLAGPDPLLVLIHGTASSTAGGFAYMAMSEPATADPWRAATLTKLKDFYKGRIAALDHKTLSVSPIQNALDVLAALPAEARLHLVSHSRGGMIGELLCRAQRIDGKAPFDGELDQLKRWADARGDVDYSDAFKQLKDVEQLLREKRPKVERFVRVACPAAGTTLASGRLDRWLSVTTSVLDLTGLSASPTYSFLKGFLLAAVKSRTDPRSVPGLEAMLPNSLLTLILNRPGVETAADLSVISGNIEGTSLLAKLGQQILDWFYGGDNDLIVDTVSMYGGLARKDHASRFFFDKGSDVNHFAYFRNRRTLDKLVDGLCRKEGDNAGFDRLEPVQEISAFLATRRAAGTRPTVFLVPHLMGSHLAVDGKRIWIDLAAIARGEIEKLAFGSVGVTADALVADAYGDLVRHLSGSYEVRPFAYDWRLSLIDNGNRLAAALRDRMADTSEPVRLLAHGSGGLVTLAAFTADETLGDNFARRNGSRLVLLGEPMRGSVPVARLLVGHSRLIRYLSLVDINHTEEKLAEIFGAMPGIIELLSTDTASNLFLPATWRNLAGERSVQPPALDLLARAQSTREKIAALKLDKLPLVQVGGAALTFTMEMKDERSGFYVRAASGVTLPTDPLAGRTWYTPAEPSELARYTAAFEAYTDLLATGSTSHLPRRPMDPPDAPSEPVELRRDIAPMFPNEQELSAAALGYIRKPVRQGKRETELRVVHGNLAFARWPVAVGHYDGDTLAGSEAQLDRALKGRLSRRRDLHIYPGPIGTAEIVLDPSQSPPGAVVIGLGRVGELSPGATRHILSHALRRYALAVREAPIETSDEMGISVVLIGAGEGGIGTRDAITALLHALVQANTALGDDAFTVVEIFEIYEDRAIQAAHSLALALKSEQFKDCFIFSEKVDKRKGGRSQASAGEDPTWWRRLQIRARKNGNLRFTDLTDRARVPVSLVATQREQVDQFIRGAVTQKDATGEFPPSVTLFELLLPARLKEESRNDRNLVLVLDTTTARYPWELLRRGVNAQEEPLSIRAGMIRQLTEKYLPDRPVVAIGNKALVVGDPSSGSSEFPPLQGAREEAELVAGLLAPAFDVTTRIQRDNRSSSLAALMGGHWRVLHLAGHGAVNFEKDGKRITGMALENGMFFTPENVGQMGAIPEFVFLNCCYLGLVDPSAEKTAEARYHELAANIATTFIKLGARAVVAAGWAIDDAAAKEFAQSLYRRLLDGDPFGSATHDARSGVYRKYGAKNNTWGAYQCYGDPAFRLFPNGAGTGMSIAERRHVHIREAIVEINNIEEDAQTLAVRDPAALQRQLHSVFGKVENENPTWLGDSELRAALGQAYAALGMFDEAIDSYAIALQAEPTAAPVRAIEQFANLKARRAVRQVAPGAAQIINDSIKLLKHLFEIGDDRRTSERWSLLGSCNKRLAQVTNGRQRTDALSEMSKCYERAFKLKQERSQFDSYPLLNWLLADTILAALGKRKALNSIDNLLRQAEAEARSADAANPSFFNGVIVADVGLGRGLLSGELDESAQRTAVDAYLKPWRRGASRLEFTSVLEQIEFIIAVLSDGPEKSGPEREQLQSALRSIATQLQSATGVS